MVVRRIGVRHTEIRSTAAKSIVRRKHTFLVAERV